MYPSLRAPRSRVPTDRQAPRRAAGVARTVILLGVTSLFTDVSSEMVAAVLPLYLVVALGFTPLQFGIIDGIYEGVTTLVRLAGGYVADRWRRHKEVAASGYALSAVCKLGLLAAGGSWAAVTGIVALDRTGKGIRTAPRDAMISFSTPPADLGRAFGVHRALDTTGAMIGPLVAFVVLALVPGSFDSVFVTSFCAAMIGLGVLVLLVENPARQAGIPTAGAAAHPGMPPRAVAGLLAVPRVRALVVAGTVLALATVSDGFVYLTLQRQASLEVGFFPLLAVGTALVYMVLAAPVGRLADRVGRGLVLLGGHLLLVVVYATLLTSVSGGTIMAITLVLLGAYYAATDGVLAALASAVLPGHARSSGLALVASGTALARLAGSVVFGAIWAAWGLQVAVAGFLAGQLAAVLVAALILGRHGEVVGNAGPTSG
jgi:MFS family permease